AHPYRGRAHLRLRHRRGGHDSLPLSSRLHGAALMVSAVVYLHGFASSSRSSKATFFGARFAERRGSFAAPDLSLPDFSTLTVTRMLEQAGQAIAASSTGAAADVALVGSSLGAFVALHAAIAHPAAVSRLVLLAPALDFGGPRMRTLGEHGI